MFRKLVGQFQIVQRTQHSSFFYSQVNLWVPEPQADPGVPVLPKGTNDKKKSVNVKYWRNFWVNMLTGPIFSSIRKNVGNFSLES